MRTPRVGVIGAGHWGKNLCRNFSELGALAAICDTDETALARQAARYPDAATSRDVGTMLDEDGIDAIAIATPPATHGRLAQAALDAGRHVFVEKPLCLDLGEAEDLCALADKRGLTLMVGHLLLYHPAFEALKEYVEAGKLGALRYIYGARASLGKIRREENALWSFAPHDISMILQLTGEMPARVTCSGGSWLSPPIADTSLSHFTFASGAQAHVFVSWLHPYKDHRLVVVGETGMVVFNDVEPDAKKLLHYSHAVGWDGGLPSVDRAEATPIAYASDEPLRRECAHFLSCLGNGTTPISDGAEARRVLSVLDACQRALSSGAATVPDPVR